MFLKALDCVIDKLSRSEPRSVVQVPENSEDAHFWPNVYGLDIWLRCHCDLGLQLLGSRLIVRKRAAEAILAAVTEKRATQTGREGTVTTYRECVVAVVGRLHQTRLAEYVGGALARIGRLGLGEAVGHAGGRAGESAMQLIDDRLVYSATDLVAFLECRHLANLERAVALRHLRPPFRDDPVLDRMARRGREYEARFLETLRADGLQIEEIRPPDTVSPSRAVESEHAVTLRAMRDGADVIYQAVLLGDRRLGYADFLRRVETPSDLGSWSYEVWDTKLARKPTAPAVLQISMYSDLLGVMQGRPPERMHLVLGGVARSTESLRVADFAAYYRLVARQFETLLDDSESAFPISTKPEPMDHCDFCSWNQACRAQWRREDDLALVANLTSRQRRALHTVGVTTRRGAGGPLAATAGTA